MNGPEGDKRGSRGNQDPQSEQTVVGPDFMDTDGNFNVKAAREWVLAELKQKGGPDAIEIFLQMMDLPEYITGELEKVLAGPEAPARKLIVSLMGYSSVIDVPTQTGDPFKTMVMNNLGEIAQRGLSALNEDDRTHLVCRRPELLLSIRDFIASSGGDYWAKLRD
jgi:hypothetical protein